VISLYWPFMFGKDAEYLVAFWTMLLAVMTGVLAASVPLSVYFYAKQENREISIREREEMAQKNEELRIARDFKIEERDKFYAQLDAIYLDIQKTIIKYPHLAKRNIDRNEDELIQYDAFAFLIWNFIESIHDYCLDQDDLHDTWHCILEVESQNFAAWFKDSENRKKFKTKFIRYIDDNVLMD